MAVSLILCDRSPDMVNAWRNVFPDESGVRVLNQNILTVPADALAVPANSFGFTDGGVDLAISRELGYTLGFFMFWLATAASSLFTWILLRPASRFNRALPPD